MQSIETGIILPKDKTMIRYGDVISSKPTCTVVVMYHQKLRVPIVKIMDDDDIWFKLDDFIKQWGNVLNIEENVNVFYN